MLYAIVCTDHPESGELRSRTRPPHLDFLMQAGERVVSAGALLSEDGGAPQGSLIIYEADSLDEARAFAADDPFARAGVFAHVAIHPWRVLPKGGERR